MSITITPNTNVLTLKKGQTLDEVLTVNIEKDSKTSKVDVYFLTDVTDSMNGMIASVKQQAEMLLTQLETQYGDIYYGAGYYTDAGYVIGTSGKDHVFNHQQNLSSDKNAVLNTIKAWAIKEGANAAGGEAQFLALHDIADAGNRVGWRSDAKKVLIWFGDDYGQEISSFVSKESYTIDEKVVTDRLVAQNITAFALSSNDLMDKDGQTSTITAATGGSYSKIVGAANIAQQIIKVVGDATTTITNIQLIPAGDTAGFITSVMPAGGKGPIDTSSATSVVFDIQITGIEEATSVDQVFHGSIDVMADGVKVTEKSVEITVEKTSSGGSSGSSGGSGSGSSSGISSGSSSGISSGISIDPNTNDLILDEEETFEEELRVTIPKGGEETPLDVYFLCDSTGSMAPSINNVKDNAKKLLNSMSGKYTDIAFGVGNYKDFSDGPGKAFKEQQSISTNKDEVTKALNDWAASGGGDFPEAQLYAFDRIAEPPGGTIGWRRGSRRVIIWFGDAPGHDFSAAVTGLSYDVNEISVINKLQAQDIMVVALSVSGDGLDKAVPGIRPEQGTRIAIRSGGAYQTGVDPERLYERMEELLGKVTRKINRLRLRASGAITPFVQSILPDVIGPISLTEQSVVPFDIVFKGVKPRLPDRDQIFRGAIEVLADGVVVDKKIVKITVPMLVFYRYSVKYVLGKQRAMDNCCDMPILSPGDYRTEINLHNMQKKTAKVEKFVTPLVSCGAPRGRDPKFVERQAKDSIDLPPYYATMDDGYRIIELLNGFAPCKSQIEDLQLNIGFLEIVSTEALSVTVIYTATDVSHQTVSIDSQVIPALVQRRVVAGC